MTRYVLGAHRLKHSKFKLLSWKIILVLILLLLAAGSAVYIDARLQAQVSNQPSTSTTPVHSTVTPSIDIFTSPYFQFQTSKSWAFITNASSSTKFVYRRGTTTHVSAEMTVYINSAPQDTQATRVLPVVYNAKDKTLKADSVSDHCNATLPPSVKQTQGETPVTLKNVKFLCDVDGTNFSVIVGLSGNTPSMNLARPDGTSATYFIYFRDLRSRPEFNEFVSIMNTFQVR